MGGLRVYDTLCTGSVRVCRIDVDRGNREPAWRSRNTQQAIMMISSLHRCSSVVRLEANQATFTSVVLIHFFAQITFNPIKFAFILLDCRFICCLDWALFVLDCWRCCMYEVCLICVLCFRVFKCGVCNVWFFNYINLKSILKQIH